MVDVLLVQPGAQHGIYGPLAETLTAIEPPTWVRMVAGWLRDRGYSVGIIDQEAEQLPPEALAARACSASPKLVAIVVAGHQPNASTQQMTDAGSAARAIKANNAEQLIVMLGNHPSALPTRTLQEESVDYVCDGEGPLTLKGLLDGEALPNIPGLVWNDGNSVRQNSLAPLIPIDDLHGDVWDLLPMNLYRSHQWQCFDDLSKRQPYASIYTTLGCSFKCDFCMINVFQHTNRYRRRTPALVVEQVEKLYREHGVRTIKFADEMFVLSRHHVTEICEGLIRTGIADDLNIWAYSRIDTVFPDLLYLMRRAGFRWLALGIESGSKFVRDGAGKALRSEDIIGTVRTIQRAGVNVIGNFMFGLRDDDYNTMCATLNLAIECMPDFANFYSTMAYPGSALYGHAVREGWTLPDSWRGYSQHNDDCRPLDTEHETGKTVLEFRDMAFNIFFRHPAYLSHVERKFGAKTRAHVEQMTTYKLKRKLTEAA